MLPRLATYFTEDHDVGEEDNEEWDEVHEGDVEEIINQLLGRS